MAAADEAKAPEYPVVKSEHSLTKKYLTKEVWEKYGAIKTETTGATLSDCVVCAVEFDDQHVGTYAADADCYRTFVDFFDPLIEEYHSLTEKKAAAKAAGKPLHVSDMDSTHLEGNINEDVPVISTRIRVGRNIEGYGLSPGITKEQRLGVEELMKEIFASLEGDLAGTYYPLLGMDEEIRTQLVADHFLFKSGDRNLKASGMERDWPEGRGIFHNKDKTFLVWVNEEDQLRIISMQKGSDVVACFERLARGIKAIEDALAAKDKKFQFSDDYGFFHSCPSNLGTGMRASVHVPLPGWNKKGKDDLKARCAELGVQPRGIHGESTKDDSGIFDISNKYRLGYSEVELVQMMIDGVNTVYAEEKAMASAASE
jgi:protein-arginine kinase